MSEEYTNVYEFPATNDGSFGKKLDIARTIIHNDEIAATNEHQLNGGEEMENGKLLEKYIDRLDADRREMEQRLSTDASERESRTREEAIRREDRFDETLKKYQQENKEREERYLKTVEEIKQIVSDGEKHRTSSTRAMWTLAITTILGIAAMVITVFLSLK